MYEIVSLQGMGGKVLIEITLEMSGVCKTKGKRNCT